MSAKQIYLDILEKYPMNIKASQYLNELNKSSFKSKTNLRNIILMIFINYIKIKILKMHLKKLSKYIQIMKLMQI